MKGKEILIIAYRFPPMGGIGTRRWAKFAKYLVNRNYTVHVVTSQYPYLDKVNWLNDIKHKNIKVHYLKTDYPAWVIKGGNGLWFRIKFKMWRITVQKKKYYLDPAQGWEKYFLPYSRDLIRNRKIKNVIVTGPPNSLHYYATYLKIEIPQINLIQDYRDQWNDSIDFEYKTYLKQFWHKEQSALMELFTITYSDKILFVSNDMRNNYLNLYSNYSNKFDVLHNGFDKDDYPANSQKNCDQFKVVYIGGLAFGRELIVPQIAEAIIVLNDDFINQNLKFTFYSNLSLSQFKNDKNFNIICKHFIFNDYIPFDRIPETLQSYSFGLSVNSKVNPHAFGTKVFDYMAMGMNIIHISEEGELSSILRNKNQLVSDFCTESLKMLLINMKKSCKDNKLENENYDQFDLAVLTEQLETHFK